MQANAETSMPAYFKLKEACLIQNTPLWKLFIYEMYISDTFHRKWNNDDNTHDSEIETKTSDYSITIGETFYKIFAEGLLETISYVLDFREKSLSMLS